MGVFFGLSTLNSILGDLWGFGVFGGLRLRRAWRNGVLSTLATSWGSLGLLFGLRSLNGSLRSRECLSLFSGVSFVRS